MPGNATTHGEENQKVGNKDTKMLLFAIIIFHLQIQDNLQTTIQNNKRVFAGYKINILKPVAFLYTSNYNFKMQ